eukprot:g1856.t1
MGSTSQELRSLAAEPSSGVLPGGSEAALRRQALAGVSVLFQNALNSYFQAQVSFRQEMEAKVSRQLRAAFPEAEESVVEAVAAGRSAASTIQEAMQRQSGTAPLTTANALQATRERCDELASLARAARDLSQLFIDVESLVNSQGEILNDIGSHIASTRDRCWLRWSLESTKRGHDELLRASAQQSACRWRWLALGLLVVIAVLIIIFTVLEHQPSHSLRTEELPAGQSAPHHWGGPAMLSGKNAQNPQFQFLLGGEGSEYYQALLASHRTSTPGPGRWAPPTLNGAAGAGAPPNGAAGAAQLSELMQRWPTPEVMFLRLGSGASRGPVAARRSPVLVAGRSGAGKRSRVQVMVRVQPPMPGMPGPAGLQLALASGALALPSAASETPESGHCPLPTVPVGETPGGIASCETVVWEAKSEKAIEYEKAKAKERRERDENFERGVHVTALKEEDFATALGPDWRTQRPTKLDFSGDRYLLDTLEGPSGGLLHPKLTKNLAYNALRVMPSLGGLPSLEYQIYVVSRLISLQKLDDCVITTQMRDNIMATNLLALDVYDSAFKKRQEELARRRVRDDSGARGMAGGVGKLKVIMESLEEVLEEPLDRSCVQKVRENSAKRAHSHAAFNIEEAFWDGIDRGSNAEMQITVSYILELITAVMERHDTARGELVESLGFLSCVTSFDLGRRCLDLLRRMMLSSDQCREEAGHGLERIVVPTVMDFGEDNINSDVTKTILLGLLDMVQEQQIREEVCSLIQELLPMMLSWFLAEPRFGCAIKVVEDLRKVTPLLQFLGQKKYPELYKLALKHDGSQSSDPPPFAELENAPGARRGWRGRCQGFSDQRNGGHCLPGGVLCCRRRRLDGRLMRGGSIEDDQARQLVNDAMNVQGRETILLKLLVIPCDDLKLIVMRCLSKVPLSQIEPDEMGAIVKCLSDVKNIGEGRTEEMPPDRQAVSQLERPEMVNKETNLIESWLRLPRCFQGERQLLRNKKVTIRILAQMANVVEGRSSYQGRVRKMRSLTELAEEEEWDDRCAQAQNFVSAGGPGWVQEFLLDLAAGEREEYYLDQYGKISDKPDMILLEVEAWRANRGDGAGRGPIGDEAQEVDMIHG